MPNNSSNNKRIAKNTLMLYLRMLLIMLIRLYSSRVVLDVLGVNDYGLYNVIGGMVVMFSFINNAMTDSTQRYLTYELGKNSIDKVVQVFKTSKYIHIGIAFVFFILLEIFGVWFVENQMTIPDGRKNACLIVMHLSVITTMFKIINVPYNSLIIAHEKMNVFAYLSIIEALLLFSILFILDAVCCDKLILYGVLILVVQLIIQIIYRLYCRKTFEECSKKTRVNRKLFKDMLSFAGWNICGNMAQLFSTHGLNMLLNVYFNPAINAARGIAVTVQGAIGQFSGSFQSSINPQITKSYASGNYDYLNKLIFVSSKYTCFLLILISIPVIFETPYLLSIWLKNVPNLSVIFLRLILFTTIIEAIINPINVAVAATGYIKKYQIFNGLITISVLPLSAVAFYCGFDAKYAFIIQLCLCCISFFVRFLVMKQFINIKINEYVKNVIVKCVIVVLLSLIIPLIIISNIEPSFERLILNFTLSLIWTFIVIYVSGMNKQERQYIKVFVYNKFFNKKS